MKLDELDIKIIDFLQRGEFAVPAAKKLSEELQRPQTTIHQRIKKLEKEKIIESYRAQIDKTKISRGITAFILAKLKQGKDPDEMAGKIYNIKGVEEVYFVTGEWYYVIKIYAKDLNDYYRISGEELVKTENLTEIMGMVSPKTYKPKKNKIIS